MTRSHFFPVYLNGVSIERGLMRLGVSWLVIAVIALTAIPARAQQATTPPKDPCQDRRGGEIAEAIVGYQQAGAASASHTQNFFFDFFISRPIPFTRTTDYDCVHDEANRRFGPASRWWGNVRVASYPQQIDTPVAKFLTDFSQTIGNVPVNKLAQSAEFVAGFERRISAFRFSLTGNDEAGRQRFVLSWFAGGGATGPFEPSDTLHVFVTPPQGSPQYAAFKAKYGAAADSPLIGFVSPDRSSFFRQYSAGVRLTTFYEDVSGQPYMAAPALVSFSLGQNEQVTGGVMEGVVARFEAFYPLVLWGKRSERAGIVYLFGTAMIRVGGGSQTTPFILQPSDVPGYDPRVAIVPEASNRDTYMIGVGIDIGQLIKKPGF
jgi:hypothetical protein